MRTVYLVAREDEFDRAPGLQLRDMPQSDGAMSDRDGTLTAHDVLEHVNGAEHIGSIDDELEALGAAWYTRGQHGGFDKRRASYFPPAYHLASDLSRMGREFHDGADVDVEAIPRTRACDADADIDDVIARARDMLRDELRGEEQDSDRLELYWRAARARMRIGYRKAARKYRGCDEWRLFWTVADAVADALRGDIFDGAEFVLRIDARACRATCEPIYPEFD
jgi:hypothetical protein